MNINKKIITGASGLLGSAISRQLNNEHIHLSSGDIDLTNKESVKNLIKKLRESSDTIIHCAAKVGGVQANINNNNGFFIDNYKMNSNILEAAYDSGYKNFVSILSTCIFPDDVEYPLTSDKINQGPPHHSNYGYAYAKRHLGYSTSIFGNMVNDSNWISIVPTNLYGIGDNFNLESSHLIPALIRKAYEAKLNNTHFVVWGDGTPLRQFVFSDDMAKIVLWAIENWRSSEPLMAINELEYSIRDVAIIIANKVGINTDMIVFDDSRPIGQYRKPAKTDVSWFKFTSLEDGISKTVDWFIDNYKSDFIRL